MIEIEVSLEQYDVIQHLIETGHFQGPVSLRPWGRNEYLVEVNTPEDQERINAILRAAF